MIFIGLLTPLMVALAVVAWFTVLPAFAISDPDSAIKVESIRGYKGVIESGDMLFVVRYDIPYATLPSELASETYVASLLTADSATELQSVVPFAFNDRGYNEGLLSFYFRASEVTSNGMVFEASGYTVRVAGNPAFFASPPTVISGSIVWRDQDDTRNLLGMDVLEHAVQLEGDWLGSGIDLVTASSGTNLLTEVDGSDYFNNAIPNLRLMVPEIFLSSSQTLDDTRRGFSFSYSNEAKDFLKGSQFDKGYDNLATLFGMPKVAVTGALLLIIAVVVIGFGYRITGGISFPLIMLAVVLPTGVVLGLASVAFVAVLGFFAVLFIAYVFYWRTA